MVRTCLTTSLGAALVIGLGTAACTRSTIDTSSTVDVRPIEVKPIHITVDVNVRVDRELDQFFAFEEEVARPAGPAQPTTAPATTAPVQGAATVKAEG